MSKVLKETYLESLGVIVLSYERARELTRQLIEKGKLSSDREMVFITKLLETARNNTSLIIKIINDKIDYIEEKPETLKNNDKALEDFLENVKNIEVSNEEKIKQVMRDVFEDRKLLDEKTTKSEDEDIEYILKELNIPSQKEISNISIKLNKLIKKEVKNEYIQ